MTLNLKELENKLKIHFKGSSVSLEDTVGDGAHFELNIVSDLFLNKSLIERHKMIYEVLGSIVGNEMHALAINATTFNESNVNTKADAEEERNLHSDVLKKIDQVIKNNKVVLFMKGRKDSPMCGFSAVVSQILSNLNVQFQDINVLANEEIRNAIKEYSNWPTIPQLYINGEFVGGCDITRELYESGELQKILLK